MTTVGLAGLVLSLACSGSPFRTVLPPDSRYVAHYKREFGEARRNLDAAIDDVVACRTVESCNEAANRVDVWTTGLGGLYWDSASPASQGTRPPLPSCLRAADAHVAAAIDPLRRGSHATYGLAVPPSSAVVDLLKARAELDLTAQLLAGVQC